MQTKKNVNVIILITCLMLKLLLKSKYVLYQVLSDLGEVNSFCSSFSEVGQKASCLSKFWITVPGVGSIFKPELLFFYFNFLAAFKGKGLHMGQKWSHWHMKSHPCKIFFNICLIKHKKSNSWCHNGASVHQKTCVIT